MSMKFLSGRLSWIAMFVLLASGSVFASIGDIYVAQGAIGAADGSSCASAKATSFFNSASNWGASATQIGPGTVVHICGVITAAAGSTAFTFNGSGASGNVITLKFETGAVLQAPYFGPNGGAIEVNGKSYIVIDGGVNGTIDRKSTRLNSRH